MKEKLGFGALGNGVTIWDESRGKNNDYLTLAHISCDRKVTYYTNRISSEAKSEIERFAGIENMRASVSQNYPVLKPIVKGKISNDYKVGDLIYDANIYDGMNTNLADLQFYKRWLPKSKDTRILELCCGTGRLTLPIARDGYDVTGVDYTSSMLDQAKIKASEAGLQIGFIEADIRTLDLQEKYDLIFIPFNSIHHLYKNEDLFKAFNVVKKHLKEGGLFLFDCFNPNIQFIVEGEKGQKEIAAYTTDDGREVLIKQTMRYETKTQINRIEWHYYINGEFNSIQNLDMRMIFPQELDSYLEWNGFKIIHKYGGFEEEIFNDNSEKQVFVCQC